MYILRNLSTMDRDAFSLAGFNMGAKMLLITVRSRTRTKQKKPHIICGKY